MFIIKFMLISSLFTGGVLETWTTAYATMDECTTAVRLASTAQQQGPVYTLGRVSVAVAAPQE